MPKDSNSQQASGPKDSETYTESEFNSDISDHIQRFTFANLPIRGEIVSISQSFKHICNQHQYSAGVRNLLGEALIACILMADIIKINDKVALQLQSPCLVKLLLVECDHLGHIRGVVHTNPEFTDYDNYDFSQWTLDGQMAITIEPEQGQRYQGVVSLNKPSLASCLEDYFNMSEQLPTYIRLFADENQAFGIFLQPLPESEVHQYEDENSAQAAFEHTKALGDTVKIEEAFELKHEQLLYRLFHQDQVTLYPSKLINFKCSCSREKNETALMTIDATDLLALIQEQSGEIEMVCDFCSSAEIFNKEQIIHLITNTASGDSIN